MGIKVFQVDAFTDKAFSGNPAAICLLEGEKPDEWMQSVAREMNLSETAFVARSQDGFHLRWFTPAVEVDLCGHATLAAAHVLWEQGVLGPGEAARFQTRSGLLSAALSGGWIEMDFPAEPAAGAEEHPDLARALGVKPRYVGKNRFDYIVEVASEAVVRNLLPDLRMLAFITERGVIVTSRSSTEGFDFVSRFFAPRVGINEDPVTGSAHCCLGPFWAERLGQDTFTAYQASARGGIVRLTVRGERVLLSGQAVTVLKGELV